MTFVNFRIEPAVYDIAPYWEAHILTLENGKYGLVIQYNPVKRSRHIAKVIPGEFATDQEAKDYAAQWVDQNRDPDEVESMPLDAMMVRDREICQSYKDGRAVSELAQHYDLSRQRIHQILLGIR